MGVSKKIINICLLFAMLLLALQTGVAFASEDLALPQTEDGEVIEDRSGFSFVYDYENRVPKWVAYKLTKEEVEGDLESLDRKDFNFKKDPDIKESPSDSNYKNSGYDRGHMAPADDLAWSEESFQDSFYTTNVVPQTSDLNQGIWRELEVQVQDWAMTYDNVYVVTGPVLRGDEPCIELVFDSICAPRHFFKVVLRVHHRRYEGIGFIMDQYGSGTLKSNAFSIDDVEKVTGIDFFHSLSRWTEWRTERRLLLRRWIFPDNDKGGN